MTGPDDRAVDRAVDAALRRIPLPDHAPDFWERVAARLPASPGTNGHARPVLSDRDSEAATTATARTSQRRRSPRRRLALGLAVATVAVVAVAGAVALVRSPGGDRVETGTSDATTDQPTTTTAPGTTTPAPLPGSEEAVLAFLDALGNGDLAGAASRLGPLSEAHLTADGGTADVEDALRPAAEGYGAWAGATDRTTSVVTFDDPGEVVVVVQGTVSLEGAVEERAQAIPARYASSAGTWLVEPFALDPAGARLEVTDPGPAAAADLDQVEATTPGPGTAWLAVDDRAPMAVTVGADATASWTLAAPLPPGRHTLTVAFVSNSVFEAATLAYDVTDDGTP